MKYVPFSVIKAAKENCVAAAEEIRKHFAGYIVSRCSRTASGSSQPNTILDEDARYFAETALLAAIFTFQFREPPDDDAP